AHELRNPLAPISSGVEVLKRAPGDQRLVERMVGTMERQTKQLVRLVDDLLEVSRISGGKLQLRKSIIELNQVVQDAIASVKPSIESAGHTLNVYFTGQPATINGDAARLTQVLSNLLSNAVRYTPRAGVISVMSSREEGSAVLSVKDNGVGISPESLGRVFEMFYQANTRRPESGAGLGIGLTLAKSLVEMHGGTIAAESAGENLGSQFTIRLPLAEQPQAVEPRAVAGDEQKVNGEHRILIVDDNVDAAETLSTLMKSLGEREVHTARSGEQALQAAPTLHPDIVLLDLMMPEMDGYEVARRMRSQPWGKNVLLVALSGLGQDDYRRRTQEAGFDLHVTKPADLETLKAVLTHNAATPSAQAV
ncbi:MAG: response regulator, partial [Sinobacteraceae bacterium]|nr:response regulator [Nevskiaceae bacterium]